MGCLAENLSLKQSHCRGGTHGLDCLADSDSGCTVSRPIEALNCGTDGPIQPVDCATEIQDAEDSVAIHGGSRVVERVLLRVREGF